MRKFLKLALVLTIFLIAVVIASFSYYMHQLSPISSNKDIVEVVIPKGATGSKVATILKEENLIRNVMVFKLYLKLHNINQINYGTYKLSESMGVKKIIDIIVKGETVNTDIKITFKEGLNMRGIAKAIADNTNNSEQSVFALLEDDEYIDSLIKEYWFLDKVIKDSKIYYPLEGYLAPNTYNFVNKDVEIEAIFKKMLDQMNSILTPLKDTIQAKKITVHEFITLASIVQSEGLDEDDMPNIASVFYNRLEKKMKFQSCVTACYATKTEPCVSNKVDTTYNSPYNTYLSALAGKLPIGPVSNPGAEAIEATVNPSEDKYLYFLSDIDKNTYFFIEYKDHQAKKAELIANAKWLAN